MTRTTRARVGVPSRDRVLAALEGGAEVTVPELAAGLGSTPGALHEPLASLAKGGRVALGWRDLGTPGRQVRTVRGCAP
jgi:hypothetical protein